MKWHGWNVSNIDPVRITILCLLIAGVSGAQETALDRVKMESARLRQVTWPVESDLIKAVRDRSADFHTAIRDWVESLLPKSRANLDAESSFLNVRLSTNLQRYELIDSSGKENSSRAAL